MIYFIFFCFFIFFLKVDAVFNYDCKEVVKNHINGEEEECLRFVKQLYGKSSLNCHFVFTSAGQRHLLPVEKIIKERLDQNMDWEKAKAFCRGITDEWKEGYIVLSTLDVVIKLQDGAEKKQCCKKLPSLVGESTGVVAPTVQQEDVPPMSEAVPPTEQKKDATSEAVPPSQLQK